MTTNPSATTQSRTVRDAGSPANAGALRFAAATDVGLLRGHNEDSYHADAAGGLWLVADGMGGHGGGDVASRVGAAKVAEACRSGMSLVEAIHEAHAAIIDAARRGEGTDRMGSTIVALRTRDHEYEIAWVGDSRAYLWNGGLRQLTRDHSLVQEYLDQHLITPEAAANDSRRGVITRCLGPASTEALVVDSLKGRWQGGDRILLSSDGMHEVVGDDGINDILAGSATAEEMVNRLVGAALQGGGPDNVTVVLIEAPAGAPAPIDEPDTTDAPGVSGPEDASRQWRKLLFVLAGAVLAAVVMILWNQRA